MAKQFNGFDEAKKAASYKGGEKLPAGAYVCKISAVKYETATDPNYSDQIAIAFDIAEGEYKDFFKNQYENNTSEDKKYKGSARIYYPKDDGSEQDGWTKNAFARWTNALEESNNGYAWDWDETKWKGKMIGIIFGHTGTVIDGKEITYSEVRRPCSVEEVKNDKWYKKAAEFKAKKGYTGTQTNAPAAESSNGFANVPDGTDEELPF